MSGERRASKAASQVAASGMLFALALALSFLEGLIPSSSFLPPGVKLGLSNIVTMYALFCVGGKQAAAVAVLKAFFVFLTRGFTAGFLSLSGGLLSLGMMALLFLIPAKPLSYFTISIIGAVFHNIGQIGAAALLLSSLWAFTYLPVLILSGIVMGVITGLTLRIVMPALGRLQDR